MNPFGKFTTTPGLLKLLTTLRDPGIDHTVNVRPDKGTLPKGVVPPPDSDEDADVRESGQRHEDNRIPGQSDERWEEAPDVKEGKPLFLRKPSYLTILHQNFAEIASSVVKRFEKTLANASDFREPFDWDERSIFRCLKEIWDRWETGVVKQQLGVPCPHHERTAKYLYFDIIKAFGEPLRDIPYPYSKVGCKLMQVFKDYDVLPKGLADEVRALYGVTEWSNWETALDGRQLKFAYWFPDPTRSFYTNNLPHVTITCVLNANVAQLLRHAEDRRTVTGLKVVMYEEREFIVDEEKGSCALAKADEKEDAPNSTDANASKPKTQLGREFTVSCDENTSIILGMGMYPAANLLMTSFEEEQNEETRTIGRDIGAHFCASVVCRIPRKVALQKFKEIFVSQEPGKRPTEADIEAVFRGDDFAEAIYIMGYQAIENENDAACCHALPNCPKLSGECDEETRKAHEKCEAKLTALNEWHCQLSVIIPSLETGARSLSTLSSTIPGGPDSMTRTSDPDYVYFNFSLLGEVLTNSVENRLREKLMQLKDFSATDYFGNPKSGYYKMNDPATDDAMSNRRPRAIGLADVRLSNLDYSSWNKTVEVAFSIAQQLFGDDADVKFMYKDKRSQKAEWKSRIALLELLEKDYQSQGRRGDQATELQPTAFGRAYRGMCSRGMVHEGCVLSIDNGRNNGPVYGDTIATGEDKHYTYQFKRARNVFVTGGGLLPSTGSWNPTLFMSAMSVHLAEILQQRDAPNALECACEACGVRQSKKDALESKEILKPAGARVESELAPKPEPQNVASASKETQSDFVRPQSMRLNDQMQWLSKLLSNTSTTALRRL